MNIEQELIKLIKQIGVENARFIVAVSGGIDSMSLLHACLNQHLDVVVAHCNFNLRGVESDLDTQLVIDYCNAHRIQYHIQHFNTTEESEKTKKSIQETARQLRYHWFENLRQQIQADYILTAHHGNDLIETFFINACRGSGLVGLSSIPAKNESIIRPWLSIKQSHIAEYAAVNNIPFRHDSSNDALHYTRNYLRHQVIPLLQQLNQDAENNLINSIFNLKEASTILHDKIDELKLLYTIKEQEHFIIKLQQLQSLSYATTLLHHWLKPYGFNSQSIADIAQHHHQTGRTWLSETHQVLYNRGDLIVSELHRINPPSIAINHIEDSLIIWGDKHIRFTPLASIPTQYEQHAVYIDISKINGPLSLRCWQHGDSFIPLGMTHSKKLSDFFIDEKIGLTNKHKIPILCQENQIIAVIPYRIDNRFKIESSTSSVLKITY